jgi:mannose-6-phosphate isomerase-like protein (cupin superfamily)
MFHANMVEGTGGMAKRNMDSPDETRKFEHGKIDLTNFDDATTIGRAVFEPGWKWSASVKPIVKTNSCQQRHTMYVISGRMRIKMDDGTEQEFGPGDAGIVPPGHDAWVVGSERCAAIDFTGAKTYAKAG